MSQNPLNCVQAVHAFDDVIIIAAMSDRLVERGRTGPVIAVADDGPILDRYLGLVGRQV
jgi:hypothetical protein